jgi:hypothetical protein
MGRRYASPETNPENRRPIVCLSFGVRTAEPAVPTDDAEKSENFPGLA